MQASKVSHSNRNNQQTGSVQKLCQPLLQRFSAGIFVTTAFNYPDQ